MIRWPFSNMHTLNLNWLILKMKDLETKVKEYATNVSASATTGAPGSQASASVTGNLDEGLNFSFTIPQGAQGPQGEQGERGPFGTFDVSTMRLNWPSTIQVPAGGIAAVYYSLTAEQLELLGSDRENILGISGINMSSSLVCSNFNLFGIGVSDNPVVNCTLLNPGDESVTSSLSMFIRYKA